MRNYFLLFLCSFLLISCKTLEKSDYIMSDSNLLPIPSLQGEIDLDNLYIVNSLKDSDPVATTLDQESYVKEPDTIKKVLIPGDKIKDIIRLYTNEINSINNKDSIKHGIIKLKILSYNEKKSTLLTFLSIWTLGIPNLIGTPVTSIKTQLDLQVSILDVQNNLIKQYNANGKGNTFVALYWGYGKDAGRKSNILAFKNAMTSIRAQLKYDNMYLKAKLNKNNRY